MNSDQVKLQNAQVWWEIHEKYEAELDSIESTEDLDEAADESEKSKKRKSKKKKGKKKKGKKK